MANSVSLTKITLLLWISLSRCSSQAVSFQGKPFDISLVSNIMNYVQPYLQSLRLGQGTSIYKRSNLETNVEDAIDAKIKELLPLLQDDKATGNENIENNLQQEGHDETTIIEFITNDHPNDPAIAMRGRSNSEPMQPNIGNYKNMRNKIKLALETESVSRKTKKMVTQTLDTLITQLLRSQCHWNRGSGSKQSSQGTLRNDISGNIILNNTCYVGNKKLSDEECVEFIQQFQPHFDHFSDGYNEFQPNFDQFNDAYKEFNEMIRNKTSSLVDMFTKPVHFIEREPTVPATKYRVRCSVVEADKEGSGKEGLRVKGSCDDFRLCSQELKEFLADFYKSLNDTAVSVFTNYAAMYVRDVTTDGSEEKNSVITVIRNTSNVAAARVRKVFMKELAKLKLDSSKRRHINVGAIKEYIKSTVKHVNNNVIKHLETDLGNLRTKILQTVREDLHINMGVELGNLESHFLGKVCIFFVTCNSEVSGSFRKRYPKDKTHLKSNSVYVKVQLTLDDEVKDKIVKQHKEFVMSKKFGNSTDIKNLRESDKNFNVRVTRTTMSITNTEPQPQRQKIVTTHNWSRHNSTEVDSGAEY